MSENDENARKLVEALTPSLIEALLPKLTEAVETQIKGVVEKNGELLAELKTAKVENGDMSKLLATLNAQEKQRAIDNALPDNRNNQPDVSVISREDARDPAKYRAAKALAAERGVDLRIGEPEPTERQPHRLDGQSHLRTETQIFMTQEAMRDVQQYKRLRALADKEGLSIVSLADWHDLPDNVGESNGDG